MRAASGHTVLGISTSWLNSLVELSDAEGPTPQRIARFLADTIPSDRVFFAAIDFSGSVVTIEYALDSRQPRLSVDALPTVDGAHQEVSRSKSARFQLSLITNVEAPTFGRGWVLTRMFSDFTDDEVEIAARLLPALAVVTRWMRPPVSPRPASVPPPSRSAAERSEVVYGRTDYSSAELHVAPVLTPQERRVLQRVAEGETAKRAAAELNISLGTARKHLENAYRKLNADNRMTATHRARTLNLI